MNQCRLALLCWACCITVLFAVLLPIPARAGACSSTMYVVCSKTDDSHRNELCHDLRRRLLHFESLHGVCTFQVFDDEGQLVLEGEPDYGYDASGRGHTLLVTIRWGTSDQFNVDLFSCGKHGCRTYEDDLSAPQWDQPHELAITARLLRGDKVKLVDVRVPPEPNPETTYDRFGAPEVKAIRRVFRRAGGLPWRQFYRAVVARWANAIEQDSY